MTAHHSLRMHITYLLPMCTWQSITSAYKDSVRAPVANALAMLTYRAGRAQIGTRMHCKLSLAILHMECIAVCIIEPVEDPIGIDAWKNDINDRSH